MNFLVVGALIGKYKKKKLEHDICRIIFSNCCVLSMESSTMSKSSTWSNWDPWETYWIEPIVDLPHLFGFSNCIYTPSSNVVYDIASP